MLSLMERESFQKRLMKIQEDDPGLNLEVSLALCNVKFGFLDYEEADELVSGIEARVAESDEDRDPQYFQEEEDGENDS